MRALWSDRPNCSHNVSQKVKRIRRFSELLSLASLEVASRHRVLQQAWHGQCRRGPFGSAALPGKADAVISNPSFMLSFNSLGFNFSVAMPAEFGCEREI